jgi:hypothetical protein
MRCSSVNLFRWVFGATTPLPKTFDAIPAKERAQAIQDRRFVSGGNVKWFLPL